MSKTNRREMQRALTAGSRPAGLRSVASLRLLPLASGCSERRTTAEGKREAEALSSPSLIDEREKATDDAELPLSPSSPRKGATFRALR